LRYYFISTVVFTNNVRDKGTVPIAWNPLSCFWSEAGGLVAIDKIDDSRSLFPGEQAVTRKRVIASYRNRAADQIAAVDSPLNT
jgi:hypothetical protein